MKTLESLPREKRQWYFKHKDMRFCDGRGISISNVHSHWSKSATNANRNHRALDKKNKKKSSTSKIQKGGKNGNQ
jgi:hypothetical protein